MAVLTINLFFFFFKLSSMIATKNPTSFDMKDKMGWEEKLKIMHLSEDLFKESMLKMRQILEIRQEHELLISYNIGMLMGRIREKYRFMSETYRDIVDSYNNASWIKPPGVRNYRPLHFIIALERMHYLELEIDKLVDVMVDEATRTLRTNLSVVGQTKRRPGHTSPKIHKRSQDDIVREETEKSYVRQRFLMEKLGKPANMTTEKKRFLRQWPVEGSWSLDKYYNDYK